MSRIGHCDIQKPATTLAWPVETVCKKRLAHMMFLLHHLDFRTLKYKTIHSCIKTLLNFAQVPLVDKRATRLRLGPYQGNDGIEKAVKKWQKWVSNPGR